MQLKNYFLILSGILIGSLAAPAMADCQSANTTVFSCKTSNAKQVDICSAGKNISYSFGKPNKPELVFSIPKSKAYKYVWDGMTTSEINEVYIPRGNTTYVAYQVNHRNNGNGGYGLKVLINQKEVANIKCASGIKDNIDSVDLSQISTDDRL